MSLILFLFFYLLTKLQFPMAELLPSCLPHTLPNNYYRCHASGEHKINCFNLQKTTLTSQLKVFVDFFNADDATVTRLLDNRPSWKLILYFLMASSFLFLVCFASLCHLVDEPLNLHSHYSNDVK